MAKFPEPPPAAELARIPAEVRLLSAGTELWRLYFRGGEHPTRWNVFRGYGPTGARFDHHEEPCREQDRKILYAAEDGPTSIAEVFQSLRLIHRFIREPWISSFALRAEVRLLDLTGIWPTRAGASMAINSGEHPRARRWARAIYEAYPTLEGLYYASSMHANRPAVALFERAIGAMPESPLLDLPLSDPVVTTGLVHLAPKIGYRIV